MTVSSLISSEKEHLGERQASNNKLDRAWGWVWSWDSGTESTGKAVQQNLLLCQTSDNWNFIVTYRRFHLLIFQIGGFSKKLNFSPCCLWVWKTWNGINHFQMSFHWMQVSSVSITVLQRHVPLEITSQRNTFYDFLFEKRMCLSIASHYS